VERFSIVAARNRISGGTTLAGAGTA